MTAMPNQTAARGAGEPRDLDIPAGVRKMPREMASPVTTAVAAHTPICRPGWGCVCIVGKCYAAGERARIGHWVEGKRPRKATIFPGRESELLFLWQEAF